MSTNIQVEKICQYCKKKFVAQKLSTKYCSHKCNSRDYKIRKKYEKLTGALDEQKDSAKTLPTPLGTYLNTLHEKQFLTVADVVKLLGISKATIYRLIKDGDLKAVRFSERTTRIKRSEIDKLFN
jgi:excisionase family DNA binding protein